MSKYLNYEIIPPLIKQSVGDTMDETQTLDELLVLLHTSGRETDTSPVRKLVDSGIEVRKTYLVQGQEDGPETTIAVIVTNPTESSGLGIEELKAFGELFTQTVPEDTITSARPNGPVYEVLRDWNHRLDERRHYGENLHYVLVMLNQPENVSERALMCGTVDGSSTLPRLNREFGVLAKGMAYYVYGADGKMYGFYLPLTQQHTIKLRAMNFGLIYEDEIPLNTINSYNDQRLSEDLETFNAVVRAQKVLILPNAEECRRQDRVNEQILTEMGLCHRTA